MATAADVARAYQNALGRAPTAAETASFLAASTPQSDPSLYAAVATGAEARQIAFPVLRYYQAAFGRVADQAGLNNAEAFIRANGFSAATLQQLAGQFTTATEFTNRYGSGTAVDAAFVNALYQNVLGRTGTQTEITAYTSGSNGFRTREQVLYAFAQSTEFQNRSTVAAGVFTTAAAQGTATYAGPLLSPTGYQGYTDSPGNDYLRGGDGADTFDLTAGGNDTLIQLAGDSGRYSANAGDLSVTGAFDLITGATAGDRIALNSVPVDERGIILPGISLRGDLSVVSNTIVAAASIGDNGLQLIRGTLTTVGANGAPSTFTAGAAGQDTLVVYDADIATGSQSLEAVVIQGFTGAISAKFGIAETTRAPPSAQQIADGDAGLQYAVFLRL